LAAYNDKASIIFLLGECGDIVQDAPYYALEKLIDNYENIKDVTFKYNLLNATMKNGCLLPVSVSFCCWNVTVPFLLDWSLQR
jgi:hypothetical protein